ncbi:MAG: helix-turn-helix transcriptional regulator [Oscillospiraceae bacterium]|nr:helix-turn-helix transcriptional regulator [Oscillospiraceae bacterium]
MEKKLLGKKINLARKDRGITSEKLSEACHINATYLRQIESGAKMPSLPVFISLCRELKASPSYLLSEYLPDPDIQDMDALWELWQTASPKQIKIISSMIRSALDSVDG